VLDDPVPDRLEAMLEEFVSDFASDRQLASLLGAHTTFFTGSGSERLVHAHVLLSTLFEAGQERDEIRGDVPATQLAQIFLELVMAMIRTWCDDPADLRPLGERLGLAMSILLRGCVTERARVRAPELDQLWSSAG
jgi:hypothetical protein